MGTFSIFSESPNVKRDSLNGKRNRNSQSRIKRNLSDSFSSDKTSDNSSAMENVPTQKTLTSKFKFVEILKNEITHSTSEQSGVISENSSSGSSKFSVPKIQYKEDNSAKIRQGKHDTFVFTIHVIQQPFS